MIAAAAAAAATADPEPLLRSGSEHGRDITLSRGLLRGLAADGRHAAGMLLQSMPAEEFDEATWQHLTTLADTLRPDELLELGTEALLRRLYHADAVRVYEPETVRFFCRCSRERVSGVLRTMSLSELLETAAEEGGQLNVSCDFCNANYGFDPVDLEALFTSNTEAAPGSSATH